MTIVVVGSNVRQWACSSALEIYRNDIPGQVIEVIPFASYCPVLRGAARGKPGIKQNPHSNSTDRMKVLAQHECAKENVTKYSKK